VRYSSARDLYDRRLLNFLYGWDDEAEQSFRAGNGRTMEKEMCVWPKVRKLRRAAQLDGMGCLSVLRQ